MSDTLGLPALEEGQMHLVIKTLDGKTQMQVIKRPSLIPEEGGSFESVLPNYGHVFLSVVRVTDKLLACVETQEPPQGCQVTSWCPTEQSSKPEQVHLTFPVRVPITHIAHLLKDVVGTTDPADSYSTFNPVMRLKTREGCEELITALTRHMNNVFPT